ncbi:GspH/FimT family pseudopilin [Calidifontimicrobium sp. SYSU G02091]|uniref:GspH/FimT family pseudopilin n=1 Tax=Calidifontimicrobium sp. SYSU G02091 TaxID=2926421 RepID=UPI001F53285E|nr:GspH/FimT family pseudopilin [Calidifontimicrobium sp. SYSU G02091]MCI1190474.1 GspH/FimT family pseudopilin [Calidifontimicrobium sp. SYSU G02091]
MLSGRGRPAAGFTVIELMVTITVLALLLMAVAPSVGAWIANTQIRNAATSIQMGLQRARSEALRRNTPVRFTLVSLTNAAVMDDSCAPSDSGVSWVVSLDDPTGDCGTAPSDTAAPRIVETHAGGVGGGRFTVAATTSGGDEASSVTFNGFGRVVGTDGIGVIDIDHVEPGADYRALRLVIGLGGTVRMCDPAVTSADDPRKC